jgi:hypothetical protein
LKKKYEVQWYECNLTEERRRRFFTKSATVLCVAGLEAELIECRVYELSDNH